MSWTEQRVKKLKKLWAEGLSANQIAYRLGEITRNAVIGKVHRLGLSGRIKTKKSKTKLSHRSRKRKYAKEILLNPIIKKFNGLDRPHAIPADEIFSGERRPNPHTGIKFKDLKNNQCKFIYGDPRSEDYCVCNNKRLPGLPYCADCASWCYQPNSRAAKAKQGTA